MNIPSHGLLIATLLLLLPPAAEATITINGINDEEIVDDIVSFEVPSEVGFTIIADLDGDLLALDTDHDVTTPGYYELAVSKTNDATSAEESQVTRFIVLDSVRGTSERGLVDWIPYPTIDSAPAAINQGKLEIIAPAAIPVGMKIPIVAWLRDGSNEAIRLNGTLRTPERPGSNIRLLRGCGAGFLDGEDSSGRLALTPTLASLTDAQSIDIEPAPTWIEIDTDINSPVMWPANSRVHITGDLTVAASASLTIGAASIIQIAPGVQIDLEGTLVVNGTRQQPVIFVPEPGAGPWGGFFARAPGAAVNASGAIFTATGADDNWFDPPGFDFHTHRSEQAAFAFSENTTGDFIDCYFFDLAGQALHGDHATINLTRCLVQRVITVGQFNGGNVTVSGSALIEFPVNDGNFADVDNDGIYFTEGSHQLIDSVIGWAKDDGVDAGSGSQGDVTVTRCWFEACYHESMAWSGEIRDADVSGSVAINSGQGIEAGWSGGSQGAAGNDPSPEVTVTNSLCVGNHIGLRFGDNYDWNYWGQLNVSNSISIHNDRDVWGLEWDSWDYRDERMDLQNNSVTQLDSRHPGNVVWDPAGATAALAPFMPTPVTVVGAGLMSYEFQKDIADYGETVTIGFSEFTSSTPTLDYEFVGQPAIGAEVVLDSGTLVFIPGELRQHLTPPTTGGSSFAYVRVSLSNPSGCTITTAPNLFYVARPTSGGAPETLVASGASSIWSYLDDGSDQGTAWRDPGFDDSSWSTGGAQLGYGDGDEETPINFGPSDDDVIPTYYFRQDFDVTDPAIFGTLDLKLLRDDGGIIYINGIEVFRSNMAAGPISYDDYADSTTSSEATVREMTVSASSLKAGNNVVAVEIHQAEPDSSDVSFDLEMIANRVQTPLFDLIRVGDSQSLLWQGDGWQLQASSNLEDWETLREATSPMIILPSTPGQPSPRRQFYRLAR